MEGKGGKEDITTRHALDRLLPVRLDKKWGTRDFYPKERRAAIARTLAGRGEEGEKKKEKDPNQDKVLTKKKAQKKSTSSELRGRGGSLSARRSDGNIAITAFPEGEGVKKCEKGYGRSRRRRGKKGGGRNPLLATRKKIAWSKKERGQLRGKRGEGHRSILEWQPMDG